ncbi:MAG: hypothetical protein HC799_15055 [Limnothrix sp. RL_2_0]|nr:hypothetical protein [Limnothrix sp. RL_2_0]
MSNSQTPSPQPTPLETEDYVEGISSSTIDVTAIDSEDLREEDIPAIAAPFPSLEPSDPNDSFLIARKLRQHNRELVKTVVQLEQALAESQERLQAQITRSRSADALLTQQSDDLNETQAEVDHLTTALSQAKQEIRDHKAVITELNQKFKKAQIQLAHIERECTLLQESHSTQEQQIVAAEQEVIDLQSRLERQQRYTIQYKSALEQQQPIQDLEDPVVITPKQTSVPKVSRIQPWSKQVAQPKPPSPILTNVNVSPDPEPNLEEILFPVEAEEPSLAVSPQVNDDLEQQLNALEIEIEAMSQSKENQDIATVPPAVKVPQFPPMSISPKVARKIMTSSPTVAIPAANNWPSPTLNPIRTQRKRSSLAAVDLPSFPRR